MLPISAEQIPPTTWPITPPPPLHRPERRVAIVYTRTNSGTEAGRDQIERKNRKGLGVVSPPRQRQSADCQAPGLAASGPSPPAAWRSCSLAPGTCSDHPRIYQDGERRSWIYSSNLCLQLSTCLSQESLGWGWKEMNIQQQDRQLIASTILPGWTAQQH